MIDQAHTQQTIKLIKLAFLNCESTIHTHVAEILVDKDE